MKYLLDTSICVFVLRRKIPPGRIFEAEAAGQCCIAEIVLAELRFGAENSGHPDRSHGAVDSFVERLPVLPIRPALMEYARQKVLLRKLGTPLHDEFDLLIAATALQAGLVLVTDNERDFVHIDGLRLENWYRP